MSGWAALITIVFSVKSCGCLRYQSMKFFQSVGGGNADRIGSAPGGVLPLAKALVASVLLHLLLLWPAELPRVQQQLAGPMAATLRAAPALAMPASPPKSAVGDNRPQLGHAPTPSGAARTYFIDTRESASFAPAPAAPLPAEAPAPEGTAPIAAAAGRNSGQLASLASSAAAGTPVPEAEALDADGLRAYRIVLARGARAHKRYPQLARERGWSGTAEVRVDVSREGRPRQVLLARSSGHDVLDREAVDMLLRAAGAATVPESLRGRAFAVSLPVMFDLAEGQ